MASMSEERTLYAALLNMKPRFVESKAGLVSQSQFTFRRASTEAFLRASLRRYCSTLSSWSDRWSIPATRCTAIATASRFVSSMAWTRSGVVMKGDWTLSEKINFTAASWGCGCGFSRWVLLNNMYWVHAEFTNNGLFQFSKSHESKFCVCPGCYADVINLAVHQHLAPSN